jgi:hypothetical protein
MRDFAIYVHTTEQRSTTSRGLSEQVSVYHLVEIAPEDRRPYGVCDPDVLLKPTVLAIEDWERYSVLASRCPVCEELAGDAARVQAESEKRKPVDWQYLQ